MNLKESFKKSFKDINPLSLGVGALTGLNSAIGFNNRGAGAVAQGISQIKTGNPFVDMGIQGASMLLNQFGYNVNEQLKNDIENNIAENNSFQSNAGDWDSFLSNYNSAPTMKYWTPDQLVKRGIFNTSGGRGLINSLAQQQAQSGNWVANSLANNASNIMLDDINNDWRNFNNPINIGAEGGLLHTLGTEWDNGLTFINNGGTHEENPNQGVQVGVDPKGTPNLVEEGEVIWNDYVFSNRLKVPKETVNKYKLGGSKKDYTYAEVVEKLQRASEERPNDPLEKRYLEEMLAMLMEEQEMVRQQEQEEEQAQQQLAMQEALQDPAVQEQLMQEQLAQENMMQDNMMGIPMMAANGGELYHGISRGPKLEPIPNFPTAENHWKDGMLAGYHGSRWSSPDLPAEEAWDAYFQATKGNPSVLLPEIQVTGSVKKPNNSSNLQQHLTNMATAKMLPWAFPGVGATMLGKGLYDYLNNHANGGELYGLGGNLYDIGSWLKKPQLLPVGIMLGGSYGNLAENRGTTEPSLVPAADVIFVKPSGKTSDSFNRELMLEDPVFLGPPVKTSSSKVKKGTKKTTANALIQNIGSVGTLPKRQSSINLNLDDYADNSPFMQQIAPFLESARVAIDPRYREESGIYSDGSDVNSDQSFTRQGEYRHRLADWRKNRTPHYRARYVLQVDNKNKKWGDYKGTNRLTDMATITLYEDWNGNLVREEDTDPRTWESEGKPRVEKTKVIAPKDIAKMNKMQALIFKNGWRDDNGEAIKLKYSTYTLDDYNKQLLEKAEGVKIAGSNSGKTNNAVKKVVNDAVREATSAATGENEDIVTAGIFPGNVSSKTKNSNIRNNRVAPIVLPQATEVDSPAWMWTDPIGGGGGYTFMGTQPLVLDEPTRYNREDTKRILDSMTPAPFDLTPEQGAEIGALNRLQGSPRDAALDNYLQKIVAWDNLRKNLGAEGEEAYDLMPPNVSYAKGGKLGNIYDGTTESSQKIAIESAPKWQTNIKYGEAPLQPMSPEFDLIAGARGLSNLWPLLRTAWNTSSDIVRQQRGTNKNTPASTALVPKGPTAVGPAKNLHLPSTRVIGTQPPVRQLFPDYHEWAGILPGLLGAINQEEKEKGQENKKGLPYIVSPNLKINLPDAVGRIQDLKWDYMRSQLSKRGKGRGRARKLVLPPELLQEGITQENSYQKAIDPIVPGEGLLDAINSSYGSPGRNWDALNRDAMIEKITDDMFLGSPDWEPIGPFADRAENSSSHEDRVTPAPLSDVDWQSTIWNPNIISDPSIAERHPVIRYNSPYSQYSTLSANQNNASQGNLTDSQRKKNGNESYNSFLDPKNLGFDFANLRYADIFDNFGQVLSDAFGRTNTPDHSYANALQAAAANYPRISTSPIGDRQAYTPRDIFNTLINPLYANAAGISRNLANSGNRGTQIAQQLALDRNLADATGKAYATGVEGELASKKAVADYNANIGKVNATMSMQAQERNAANRQRYLNYLAQALAWKGQEDTLAAQARSANRNRFVKSLANAGNNIYDTRRANAVTNYVQNLNGFIDFVNALSSTNPVREVIATARERLDNENR